jgi:hypothetical protein
LKTGLLASFDNLAACQMIGRLLIAIGLALVVLGLLWPLLGKLGLG